MMPYHLAQLGPAAAMPFGVPRMIESIGTEHFGEQLLSLLHGGSGADHCSVFEFGGERFRRLGSASLDGTDTALTQFTLYLEGRHWQRDPVIVQAKRNPRSAGPIVIRINTADLPRGELRDVIYGRTGIRERVIVCGRREHGDYGLSVLRTDRHGGFSDAEVTWLTLLADTLISASAKHAEIMGARERPKRLNCLTEIQTRVTSAPEALPRRESEVCARILYGLSTTGIALDIGIGEESVVTYRKRAFHRLGIATRRELLLWYLDL